MSGQAKITSVEALAAFRADMIVYLGHMRPVIEEVGDEVARMKYWLQIEQRGFWETQLRVRRLKLEEAQVELFSAKMSALQRSSTLQTMAVQRAQRAVHEAEQKLVVLKRWERELEALSDPLLKQVEQLQGYLTGEMETGVLFLDQAIRALDAYTALSSAISPSSPSSPPAPETTSLP
jgi:hypothetical protein